MSSRPLAPNALLAGGAGADVVDRVAGPLDPLALTVLEAFAHEGGPDRAVVRVQEALRDASARLEVLADDARLRRAREALRDGVVFVSPRALRVVPAARADPAGAVTLTRLSAASGLVLLALFGLDPPAATDAETTLATVAGLRDRGLLVPAVGTVEWGDLRRSAAVCQSFGLGRGTPIDRHYLSAFVDEVRPEIAGRVLDVGGGRAERVRLRLAQLADLRTLDRNAGPGIDIVADVHDAGSVAPESLDVVLLFNVLEHCVDPAVVVDNIHGWLREGGRCFCMVPNAQRQHDAPSDYWRFSPAGLEHLFRSWSATSVRTYGSLTTVLGSYAGVAAEELDPEELARHDPAYPVATCLAATR